MAFEVLMRDCANEEDRRVREAEALEREEARLAAVAVLDARLGNYEKLLSVLYDGNNDNEIMSALMQCAADGHAAAIAVIKKLANTYGSNNAEVYT